MKLLVEVRPGEGGEDAKLLVKEQARIYQKFGQRHGLSIEVSDNGKSWLTLVVEGDPQRLSLLRREAGGHRWQRISPTERRGRVHTSTVTVAVMELRQQQYFLQERDIDVLVTKDSGPGGQHRNKTESCVVMRHRPTGIEAKASMKHQHRNREIARMMLESRVEEFYSARERAEENQHRQSQIGSGMRGDKIRTYRCQDDVVTDHRNGRKARLKDVLDGELEVLSK